MFVCSAVFLDISEAVKCYVCEGNEYSDCVDPFIETGGQKCPYLVDCNSTAMPDMVSDNGCSKRRIVYLNKLSGDGMRGEIR